MNKVLENIKNILKEKYRSRSDLPMIAFLLALCLFGILMVFSASYYTCLSKNESTYKYLINDAAWMALGWTVAVICSRIDYHACGRVSGLMMVVSVILLVIVLTPLGHVINNARRWIKIWKITIMPGEIAKTALIFFIAKFYSDEPEKINRWADEAGNVPVIIWTVMFFALVLAQPNMSTAATIVAIAGCMLIVAGMKTGSVLFLGGLAGTGAAAYIYLKGSYMLTRVMTVFDPFKDAKGDGYQVVQSLLALGSGGVFGVGLGKSVQKTLYLPEPQSDFILAIIGEELGYVGILCLMAVYLLLIWRIVRIAIKAPDYYGMLLASGVAIHLAIQVILNIAVVSATFPPTGVVLPFISLGGNATLLFLGEMGVVMNISRQIIPDEEEEALV